MYLLVLGWFWRLLTLLLIPSKLSNIYICRIFNFGLVCGDSSLFRTSLYFNFLYSSYVLQIMPSMICFMYCSIALQLQFFPIHCTFYYSFQRFRCLIIRSIFFLFQISFFSLALIYFFATNFTSPTNFQNFSVRTCILLLSVFKIGKKIYNFLNLYEKILVAFVECKCWMWFRDHKIYIANPRSEFRWSSMSKELRRIQKSGKSLKWKCLLWNGRAIFSPCFL